MKKYKKRINMVTVFSLIVLFLSGIVGPESVFGASNDLYSEIIYDAHVYRIYNQELSWSDAERFCESMGGHLVTITSEEEQNAVYQYVSENEIPDYHAWIGCSDISQWPTMGEWVAVGSGSNAGGSNSSAKEHWRWVTGEPMVYTNWGSLQPDGEINKDGDRQNYGVIITQTRTWHEDKTNSDFTLYPGDWDDYGLGSSKVKGFICEWESYRAFLYGTTDPSEIPDAYDEMTYNSHVYRIFNNLFSWEGAEQYCENMGGHLVTITSEGEQNAVRDYVFGCVVADRHVWIGCSDCKENGSWEWVTGEPLSYSCWGVLQPDGKSNSDSDMQDYGVIMTQPNTFHVDSTDSYVTLFPGDWDDFGTSSSSVKGMICEWDSYQAYIDGTSKPLTDPKTYKEIIYNSHIYCIFDRNISWMGAEIFCESLGGHLVTLTSEEEQNIISGYMSGCNLPDDHAWIGISDRKGNWEWVTGEEVSYTHWGSLQPDGQINTTKDEQDYGAMITHPRTFHVDSSNSDVTLNPGEWDDFGEPVNCFICEWENEDAFNQGTLGSSTTPDYTYEVSDTYVYTDEDWSQYVSELNNAVQYFCNANNFYHVQYISNNDNSVFGEFEYKFTNFIRLKEGWKELLSGETSIKDAEKILYSVLYETGDQVTELATAKTGKKAASLLQKSLKDYLQSEAFDTYTINQLDGIMSTSDFEKVLTKRGYEASMDYVLKQVDPSSQSKLKSSINDFKTSSALQNGIKALGIGLDVIDLVHGGVDQYIKVAKIQESNWIYGELLHYIMNNALNKAVKQAAFNLLKIQNDSVEEAMADYMVKATGGVVTSVVIDTMINEIWFLEAAKFGFDAGSFLSNLLFHTQDTVSQKSIMRMCAYIGQAISGWVLNHSFDSMSSKGDYSKAELAVSGLNLLAQVRLRGEEALKTMSSYLWDKSSEQAAIKAINIVKTNQEKITFLENYHLQLLKVACPVDVEILDTNNQVIFTIHDGKEMEGQIGEVYYSSVYSPITNDYVKIVVLPENRGYSYRIKGNDVGRVSYELSRIGAEGSLVSAFKAAVCVDENTMINITPSEKIEETSYVIIEDDEVVDSGSLIKKEDVPVAVAEISSNEKRVILNVGDRHSCKYAISPGNANNQNVSWKSEDEETVSVDNQGVITALKEGNTTVSATTDDGDKSIHYQITVSNKGIKHPHNLIKTDANKVICEIDGNAVYWTCLECQEFFSDENGMVRIEKDSWVIPAKGHKWNAGIVTKAPTATSSGIKTYTCSVCKKTKTKTIKKLTPTIKLSAKKKTVKKKKSFLLKVSKMAKGDSIKSVKSNKKRIATVKKVKRNKYKITGKKKGKVVITVTLKSGKKAKCMVVVK